MPVSAPSTLSARLRAHLFGATAARPVALFRILFGLVVALDGLDRLGDARSLYSDEGVLPRAILRTVFPHLVKSPLAYAMGSVAQTDAVILLGVLVALIFALGFYARLCAALIWVYLLTLWSRNYFAADGGDLVLITLAFWSMFIDLDATWSVRGGRRAQVPAWPVRIAECQVAAIYLVAGISKSGPLWRHGQALFAVLQLNGLSRPAGMALLAWPALCVAFTYFTLLLELGFFPLVIVGGALWPRLRALGLVAAALFHVGIFLLMRVGLFSYVMLAALSLFTPAAWLSARAPEDRAIPSKTQPRWLAVLLAAQLGLVLTSVFLRSHAPRFVGRELHALALLQEWKMFSPDPPEDDAYWAASGTRADGSAVDVLVLAAPGTLPQSSFHFSRWYKWQDSMTSLPQLQALLLRYVCRQLSTTPTAPALTDVRLILWQRRVRRPWQGWPPFTRAIDMPWHCHVE